MCRLHLLASVGSPRDLDSELGALAARVRAWRRATEPGESRDIDERTAIAWLEGLGWLAGWDAPAAWARR